MSEPSTPTKRSASSSPTLPKSSTKKSKPNNPKSKAGNTPKKENASTDRKTPKHIYAEMIFEAGLRALNKAEVQEAVCGSPLRLLVFISLTLHLAIFLSLFQMGKQGF